MESELKTSEKSPGKGKRAQWIPVVAALIYRQGKVLLGRRPEGHTLAGVWEFPGGKIELGEAPAEALRRELREELGIEARVDALALAATHQFSSTGILILFFEVSSWKGELKPVHHSELRWVEPSEIIELSLPEANRKVLPDIIAAIKAHG